MIPTTEVSSGTQDALLFYLAMLSILLVIGTILRLKVPFLKKYYIPASLVAGFIGLLCGKYFLGIIPAHITSAWSNLSGRLIVIVFAPMLMGKKKRSAKQFARKTFNATCYAYLGCFAQYAIPLILAAVVFIPLLKVNPLFATTFEEGWAGGHGTASGMLAVFEEVGWAEGQSIAVTNATVGLVAGIFGGVTLINIGVRKGWTRFLKANGTTVGIENKEEELYTENRPVDTTLSISGQVIDNYAFHAMLLGVAIFLGYLMNRALKIYLNFSLSWFVTAMFAGGLLQLVLNKTKWGDAVDMRVMSRIQGISLEFLIAGAVASLNVSVVIDYALPILITSVALFAFMLFFALVYARGAFGDTWFENAMMMYGTYTGVAATGILLLKVCDPEAKSDALDMYAARAPFSSWATGGGVITSMAPIWVAQYGITRMTILFTVGAVVAALLPVLTRTWYSIKQK
ncbi:MAG: hypothetical protein IKQ69_02635 [Oscillospiraceae bacterium]|nr:hypothetical protein [Oscillospiraceae bacterium]